MIKKIYAETVMEEICKESAEADILIYGAGNYGRITSRYLKGKYNVNIKCFVVSSKGQMNCDEEENMAEEIFAIDEIADENRHNVLIVAAAEQKHPEMAALASELGFEKIYLVLNEYSGYMKSELRTGRLKPLEFLNFEIHITDHCNLNCRGCIHFSPLSKESYLPTDEFERDFEQMKRLCGDRVSHIVLLGGEPLLHPQVTDFLYITRKYFKKCAVTLLTNGTLLGRMDEGFWSACLENNIILKCTKYPVKVDYESIERKAGSCGIKMVYQNDVGEGEKTLFKFPFDLQGTQSVQWNYEHCTRSNYCITLKHGRLFTCPLAAHMHIAKDFFDLDIELSEKDSIDIYKAGSFEEITKFLVTPIPFCRYCDIKTIAEQKQWGVSKRRFEEWF